MRRGVVKHEHSIVLRNSRQDSILKSIKYVRQADNELLQSPLLLTIWNAWMQIWDTQQTTQRDVHFAIENKNIETLENLQRILANYLCSTKSLSTNKLYNNLGKSLFNHKCRTLYPIWKKKAFQICCNQVCFDRYMFAVNLLMYLVISSLLFLHTCPWRTATHHRGPCSWLATNNIIKMYLCINPIWPLLFWWTTARRIIPPT